MKCGILEALTVGQTAPPAICLLPETGEVLFVDGLIVKALLFGGLYQGP